MKLRWKKHPAETGLAAVGAGSYRASDFHDGATEFATVYPNGGTWRGPLKGWYFTARVGSEFINTYPRLFATDGEAKQAAAAWVRERLAND